MTRGLEQRGGHTGTILRRAVGLAGLRRGYQAAETHEIRNGIFEAAQDVLTPASHTIALADWQNPVEYLRGSRRRLVAAVADLLNVEGSIALGFVVGASTRNSEAGIAAALAGKTAFNALSYALTDRLLRRKPRLRSHR